MIETFELGLVRTWGVRGSSGDQRFELRPGPNCHTRRAMPRGTMALAATHPTAVSLDPLRSSGQWGRQRGIEEGYPLPGPTAPTHRQDVVVDQVDSFGRDRYFVD